MHLIFKKKELDIAVQLILKQKSHKVIRIDGPMGVGKTTLISALCKTLNVEETISSPSFSIVNTYKVNNEYIYHFDFYRLENQDEALDFGVEEYFESGALCLLEWAEKISHHLPLEYDHFTLELIDLETRKLSHLKI
jgi:tRNA threonylcarbamoyladenosine biosynthesis protein TsaE|tara:strand:+ start:326 stop:736 length:411 start_codon:yes stop_codon:yes gene_type:complete